MQTFLNEAALMQLMLDHGCNLLAIVMCRLLGWGVRLAVQPGKFYRVFLTRHRALHCRRLSLAGWLFGWS